MTRYRVIVLVLNFHGPWTCMTCMEYSFYVQNIKLVFRTSFCQYSLVFFRHGNSIINKSQVHNANNLNSIKFERTITSQNVFTSMI